MATPSKPAFLAPSDTFVRRHIGPDEAEIAAMLQALDLPSVDALIDETVPEPIRLNRELKLDAPRGESELIAELREMASQNKVARSYIGMGYADCIVPPVIQRNVLESPGWYTQYTPYQAEISQGRLEALLNFQTMVSDLTGLPLANASLLDEATAAAEAMSMAWAIGRGKKGTFFASERCHPQTLAVLRTRAEAIGIDVVVGDHESFDFDGADLFGALVQYPTSDGVVLNYESLAKQLHEQKSLLVVAADLLSLCLLRAPGEFGADIVIGSSQRFGVPLGYGGPHAAFMATRDEYKRNLPGRIIGLSKDAQGRPALRMALQTREQHIRRDKATSNICTAQVLLAIMSGFYAVYHGPEGLRTIAERVHGMTLALAAGLREQGHKLGSEPVFDTLRVNLAQTSIRSVLERASARGVNLRAIDASTVGVTLDETTTVDRVAELLEIFGAESASKPDVERLAGGVDLSYAAPHARTTDYMTHPVFHEYRSEHEMLRYIHRLQARDLSLTTSMIALGSCTMKLNGTSEMLPITWPEFANIHPFAPLDQTEGYQELFDKLSAALCEICGFAAFSLQPNAGSQGEFTGLLTIRAYHHSRGDEKRNICLIPVSAHGTNPASAVMCGMKVVTVACDDEGNIDTDDLKAKAEKYKDTLAAMMVTYPSTHGVFEVGMRDLCAIVHDNGGRVYMDGANMNAQVGLCRPGDIGADVCHLNLHKTFCIPHGGGGPGMGPIGVVQDLAPFLPTHPVVPGIGGEKAVGAVAAAPWGSPSILPISYVYIALMGASGLKRATEVAILNANYMAKRLEEHYPVLYRGAKGRAAHEFIIDLRPFEKPTGIVGEDVAKRLMDYGFHAPTMSFPVAGTLMIEPTESESKAEMDRFCDAMISIRGEIADIERGRFPKSEGKSPLENAPHTASEIAREDWPHGYTREEAAFPAPWVKESKFWPAVGRIDNGFGDKNLICTCPPIEAYQEDEPADNKADLALSSQ